MAPALLLYAVAGSVAIALMVGAIMRDALIMRRTWRAPWAFDGPDPAPWYALALVVSVGLFLVGAVLR